MDRSEVIRLLRQLEKTRAWVERMESALDQLTEEEGQVLDIMCIHPLPRASDKLCEMFDIEVSAVYKRRNKALKKLGDFLEELV